MRRTVLLVFFLFVIISLFFFYPIFKGNVPFPGDLLVGEYGPYSGYSFLGFNPGSFPNKGQDFDIIRLIYPAKEFSIQSLKAGVIPLWNPYNFSGNPHLASFQSGTFYPLNIIFFAVPFIDAWTIYIILQPILAGIFTYLLLKEYRLSSVSSIFGAIAFSFSSFMSVWMLYGNLGHSFVWLPLILLLIHKIVEKPNVNKSAIIVLVLTLCILAGYIQTALYVFLFAFVYGIFLILGRKTERLRNLLYLSLLFLLSVLFSAIQLFPSIELFQGSTRTSLTFKGLIDSLIPLNHLVTLFAPDFFGNPATRNYWLTGTYIERVSYIGIVPLFFVLFAISKKNSRILKFYLISAVVIFLLVFDTFITRFVYSIFIPPIISTGVPSRMMFLFCFSLAVLSAFGFNEFYKKENLGKFLKVSSAFLFVLFLLWGFVIFYPAKDNLASSLLISKRNLIIPTGILVAGLSLIFLSLKLKKYVKLIILGIFILTIAELFYFFQKITPFAPKGSTYPKTAVLEKLRQMQGIDRSWGYGSGYIESNIETHEKIFGVNGYDALHLKPYGEFVTASAKGEVLIPARSEAVIAPGYGNTDLRNNTYRQNVLNLLGVKYVIHKYSLNNPDYETFPEDKYKLIWSDSAFQIYENLQALPRFFLTSDFIIEKNKTTRIESLAKNNLGKKVILEEDPGIENVANAGTGEAKLIKYSPNKISFETSADRKTLLFLSDTFEEGWRAKIDGNYAKILKADHAFRTVVVPAGEHIVEFSYYPKSFDLGFKTSLIAIAIGLVFILFKSVKLHAKN